MRLTQISRQPFVGIELRGQVLRPAPFPLALGVFCALAEPSLVELIPRYLAPFGERSPHRHTGAGGARDKLLLLVENVAFDEADGLARANNFRLSTKLRLPDRP